MEGKREEEIMHPPPPLPRRSIPLSEVVELTNHLQSLYINNEINNPFLVPPRNPLGISLNRSPRSVLSYNGTLNENPNMGFFPSSMFNNGFDPHWDSNALNMSIPRLSLASSSSQTERLRGVYDLAKDYRGYRSLQAMLDEGRRNVDLIFDGVIGHVGELMMHPYGNYLMQKLFEYCSVEQTTAILLELTMDPSTIFRISLDSHGTRSVQKLIETLGTHEQISLFMAALRPGLVELMTDIHGNHVIQQCLTSLRLEDMRIIFDAATEHCVEIATHQYGCCFLQRLIGCSTLQHRANLVAKIISNGIPLAQDPFGNYVIQYIIGLKSPSANARFASLFKGNYVQLSMQKFSSNVVEKCFKEFGDNFKAAIVYELLSVPRFEQLLQHPFANFVIKSALLNTQGPPYTALVDAIRPHASVLRTSPYCKQIFQLLSRKSSGF